MAPINHSCISPSRNLSVADYSIVLHQALADVSAQSVDDAFLLLSQARSAGRTIYVAGNGGSAVDRLTHGMRYGEEHIEQIGSAAQGDQSH